MGLPSTPVKLDHLMGSISSFFTTREQSGEKEGEK